MRQNVAGTLLFNLLLALAWTLLVGELTPRSFIAGFVIGWLALSLIRGTASSTGYLTKVRQVLRLVGSFLWMLIMTNVELAYEVITPGWRMRPRLISLRLDAESDLAITLLANMISLTPGTLSVDLSPDNRVLYVHAVFAAEPEQVIREIKNKLERPLLEVLG